ncbi:MAG: MSCRAMM family adhesin SdrC, partial [Planctomycetes bacterium]|nr:MSCRAMM family adhesin SdrC [Planctomycetota bacterium]
EALVASSNPTEVTGNVQTIRNDDVWRQARIPLDEFAGFADVRLRFDFQGNFGGSGFGGGFDPGTDDAWIERAGGTRNQYDAGIDDLLTGFPFDGDTGQILNRVVFTDNNADGAYSTGDDVWIDTNSDGLYDVTETIVAGAPVAAQVASTYPVSGNVSFRDVAGNGVFDAGTDEAWIDVAGGTLNQFNAATDVVLAGAPADAAAGQTLDLAVFTDNDGDGAFSPGDDVWIDSTTDGNFNTGEPVVAGAPIDTQAASVYPVSGQVSFQNVGGGLAGVHIDDVIIGFAERGEMITQADANPAFQARQNYNTSGRVLSGPYQLEIRQATDYGRSEDARVGNQDLPGLVLTRSFDTNDRHTQQTTIVAPAGNRLADGDTFTLGDGSGTLVFEFDDLSLPAGHPARGVAPGHVQVGFLSSYTDARVAAAIRDAINSPSVQVVLDLQAGLSDGTNSGLNSGDNLINLYGRATVEYVKPSFSVLSVGVQETADATEFGNDLRDLILGGDSRITAVGDAAFVGGFDAVDGVFTSAGVFSGGLSSIGLDQGIVLTTGSVATAEGPNIEDAASEQASGLADTVLNTQFGISTTDSTSLQFDFTLSEDAAIYLNFVFASEEYNELANTANPDALGILIQPQGGTGWTNLAVIPGTSTRVSRNTVNGGNPLGTSPQHANLYNNNDPGDGGNDQREFGFDGFTDVFTASSGLLTAGTYTIRIAIADVSDFLDRRGDSGVFIEAGSLSTQAAPHVEPLITGILHDGFGDQNHFRDQGQIVIHSNTITDSADFAIVTDGGERDADRVEGIPLANSHIGPARNLRELNNETNAGLEGGFAPGPAVINNTISGGGLGGIHVSGDIRPWELTPYEGQEICDGDSFSITVFRTTVEFEFEDLAQHAQSTTQSGRRVCPANPGGGDGWTTG